jgi:hypothetical protein
LEFYQSNKSYKNTNAGKWDVSICWWALLFHHQKLEANGPNNQTTLACVRAWPWELLLSLSSK